MALWAPGLHLAPAAPSGEACPATRPARLSPGQRPPARTCGPSYARRSCRARRPAWEGGCSRRRGGSPTASSAFPRRSIAGPSTFRQRVTFREVLAIKAFTDSMTFVEASDLRNSFGSPGRVSISISGMPYRSDLAAPGKMSSCFDARFSSGTTETESPSF